MFNLEQSIRQWRRKMLAAGIKSPVPLDELESHLREEIESQLQSGMHEHQAFKIAVQRMGHACEIKKEFKDSLGTGLLRMGAIGLVGTPIMNLIGLFAFHRSSSVFFSDKWCSAWLPFYLIWATCFMIGLANSIWDRKEIRN